MPNMISLNNCRMTPILDLSFEHLKRLSLKQLNFPSRRYHSLCVCHHLDIFQKRADWPSMVHLVLFEEETTSSFRSNEKSFFLFLRLFSWSRHDVSTSVGWTWRCARGSFVVEDDKEEKMRRRIRSRSSSYSFIRCDFVSLWDRQTHNSHTFTDTASHGRRSKSTRAWLDRRGNNGCSANPYLSIYCPSLESI